MKCSGTLESVKRAGEKRGLFILPPNKTIKFKGHRLIVQQDSQVIEVTLQQYFFSALIRCMFAKIKQKRRVVGSVHQIQILSSF